MKAAAFDYSRASTIDEALALLATHGDQARILSGGQSLLPAMNLRMAAPELLVDIGGLSELRGITVSQDVLTIGALTRHVEILNSAVVAEHAPLLAEAMAYVAHPAIRNRGTLGGNLAHADPASEMPACMLALDATLIARSTAGERRIPAVDFFVGVYETALRPDEILARIEIPVMLPGTRHFFCEYARRKGDYAIVGLAASARVERGEFAHLRLGYFAVADCALLSSAADVLLNQPVTPDVLQAAQAALDQELDPQDDQQASSAMRKHLARQVLARAVAQLLDRPDLEPRKSV